MGKLFGTDGARGIANSELTCELAMAIGRAAAMVLLDEEEKEKPIIFIGKDTRLSSDMLEGALTAGLCSVGADVVQLGTVPTPAVAYLVRKYNASAGIMISASHNPHEFNGIKLFNGEGYKLPDELEDKIEKIIGDPNTNYPAPTGEGLGKVTALPGAVEAYINHIAKSIEGSLEGLKIAVDCSNGSASATAEKLFTKLGADYYIINDKPNGININEKCGSTHMDGLIKYVKENNMDCGIAYDGDADRCLAVNSNGEVIDGDFIIAICAKDLKERGKLSKNSAVGTVMTNMGFNKFCEESSIHFEATKVGDRYVLENMRQNGYNLGGEQSGHVIFLDYGTTGDGQLTSVQLLSIMKRTGKTLEELSRIIKRYPQVLVNLKVSADKKDAYQTDEAVIEKIKESESQLGNRGRVLVRASGTEPLIRVMLEGENYEEIEQLANGIVDTMKERLC